MTTTLNEPASLTLQIERTIAASRAALWRCWTEPDLLKRWYCPAPWRVAEADLDVRSGGRFDTVFAGPDGERIENRGAFLEVVAHERLTFSDGYREGFIPQRSAFMTGFVTFSDAPDGGTRIVWGARHATVETRDQHLAMGFEAGWNAALDQLDALARSLPAQRSPIAAPAIYLFFAGDCFEAMSFYAETLGGEVVDVVRNADAPRAEDRMPGDDDMVMNLSLRLGECLIMASDCPPEWYDPPQGVRVQLAARSRAEFDRVFEALSKDARAIAMPPGETFWAERFTMFTDRFGTPWMLNFEGAKARMGEGD